jgi:tight adherence protein B
MRRAALALVVGAAVLAGPAGQASAAISLSPTGDAKFPRRAFVVTLPETSRLAPDQVSVTENGAPVDGLRTAPVGSSQRAKLGVVLAIDASSSMRGDAFASAIEAARAFASERNPEQPLALVTFGTGSRVLQPFTTLDPEIQAALDDPGMPSGGTDMYDAALRSVQMIDKAGLKGGFVVVLSDGTDHGSAAGNDDVVAAASSAHVRVYTVGLQSEAFDPDALSVLADTGGGSYSEATSAGELQEIYRVLGAELSNAHVVSYRSLARPGKRVKVRASVTGLGAATSFYTAPKLRLEGVTAAPPKDDGPNWDSGGARLLIVIVVVGLLGLSVALVLKARHRTPRDRVAQFINSADEDDSQGTTLTGRIAAGAERSISNASAWEGLAATLDIAGIRYTAGEIVIGTAVAAVSLTFLMTSLVGPLGLLTLVVIPLGVWLFIRFRMLRERRRFAEQLADHLAVVGGSLRVGHSLTGALASALDEAPEPARREFARAVTDERLGMPLEEALEGVSERMDNREIEHISLLAKLQREAGADAGEMVDQVVATVRERQELRRVVRTLTAQGRFSQMVLTLLPIGSLLFLTLAAGEYVAPLYETTAGHIVLAVAAVLIVCGALVIRKIVSFKV